MSTVWGKTDGCANQYRYYLYIYSMTVLSSSYSIIMDRTINATGHRENVIDGLISTYKRYLKG